MLLSSKSLGFKFVLTRIFIARSPFQSSKQALNIQTLIKHAVKGNILSFQTEGNFHVLIGKTPTTEIWIIWQSSSAHETDQIFLPIFSNYFVISIDLLIPSTLKLSALNSKKFDNWNVFTKKFSNYWIFNIKKFPCL